MTEIVSKAAGRLSVWEDDPELWISESIAIPFFGGCAMRIACPADSSFLDRLDRALIAFLNLSEADHARMSKPVFEYCRKILPYTDLAPGHPLQGLADQSGIWNFIQPQQIFVGDAGGMYLQVTCECDWDPEHGLQLVFRNNELVQASAQGEGFA